MKLLSVVILAIFCALSINSFADNVPTDGVGYQPHHREFTSLLQLGRTEQPLKFVRGNTNLIVRVPILQLNYAAPMTEEKVSFVVKVGSLIRPGAVYTYVSSAGKTLTSKFCAGTSEMFPLFELVVVKTVTEIGPAYTVAKTPSRNNQLAGIGASIAVRQPAPGEVINGLENLLTHVSIYAACSYDIDTSAIEPSAGFTFKF